MSTENLMRREYQKPDREPDAPRRPAGYAFQEYPKYVAPIGGGAPVVVHSAEEERTITGASPVVSPPEPAAPAAKPAPSPLTGRIIRAARALLGWTQGDLAEHAGVSLVTVQKIESQNAVPGKWDSVAAVERVLIDAGVSWRTTPEECGVALMRE